MAKQLTNDSKVTPEFVEFMNKIQSRMKWVESEKELSLTSSEGIELKLSLEVRASDPSLPIQVIVRLFKNGVFLTSWGCESNYDNAYVLNWYGTIRKAIRELEYARTRELEVETIKEFNTRFNS